MMTDDWAWRSIAILVAATAALVALLQWHIAREKLRHDLFDRRWKIFEAARRFIRSIVANNLEHEAFRDYWDAISGVDFLFGDEIVKYVEKIRDKAAMLSNIQGALKKQAAGQENQNMVREQITLQRWFNDQLEETGLHRLFAPYMRFRDHEWSFFRLQRWRRRNRAG